MVGSERIMIFNVCIFNIRLILIRRGRRKHFAFTLE